MPAAIIYTRVSTEDQVKGLSLANQEQACREFATRNGYTIQEIFCEEGASAKTTERKKLIELLAYCKKHRGSVDALIVWKVDRFARRSEDHHTLRAYLSRLDVKLVSVTEPIEDTNTGRLMESMLAAFAQFDNEVRTERANNGLVGRAEEGGWITYAPLGYFNARDTARRPTLRKDPDRAPLIEKLFREYATGDYNLTSIGRLANELGLRSKTGRKLHKQPILTMLRNPAYMGYRKSKISGNLIKCLHPPIISEDIFGRVQMVLDGKKKQYRIEKDREWPLRGGFVKCTCGAPLTGANTKGKTKYYPKYNCPRCRKSITGKSTTVDRDQIHAEFVGLLKHISPKPRHCELFKRHVLNVWNDEYKEMADEKERVQRQLIELDSKRERVLELFIDGSLTKEEKDSQFEKIDGERTILRIRRSELEQDVDDREDVIEVGVEFLSNISTYWLRSPLELQRKFQNIVFPEGIIYEFESGFKTPKLSNAYLLMSDFTSENVKLAGETGRLSNFWPLLKLELLQIYNTIKQNEEVLCRTKIPMYSEGTSVSG